MDHPVLHRRKSSISIEKTKLKEIKEEEKRAKEGIKKEVSIKKKLAKELEKGGIEKLKGKKLGAKRF